MTADDEGSGSSGPSEPIGSLAEEAAKLAGVLADWARTRGPKQASWTSAAAKEHSVNGAAECTWCPLCQLIGASRTAWASLSPEAREQMTAAVTTWAATARSLLDLAVTHDHGRASERSSPTDTGVEPIDLSEDTPWD
ncbi:MAG: hypothetical protein ACRDP1_08810 [Nocardioidaceae bacterium]